MVTQQNMAMTDEIDRAFSTVYRIAKHTVPVTSRPAHVHAPLTREDGAFDRLRFLVHGGKSGPPEASSGRVSHPHGSMRQRNTRDEGVS